ncbi:MAG: SHOCT domain-containing protein [Desulfobulbaceae bacterium]|nr:SHOCT domain-containing protein [Desulfobulbaceae bacterium]
MKSTFIFCLAAVLILGGHNAYASHRSDGEDLVAKLGSSQEFYTAYNLYAFGRKVHSINYKHGTLIPIGTKIKSIYMQSWYLSKAIYFDAHKDSIRVGTPGEMSSRNDNFLTFVTDDDNKYSYIFRYRFHPGRSFEGYFNKILSTENFSQQTDGFNEEVIAAIRKGVVIEGMTREQVIMSMGYPPEHRTSRLDSPEWLYWMTKQQTNKICFNFEGITLVCGSDPKAKSTTTFSSTTSSLSKTSPVNPQSQDIKSRFDVLNNLLETGMISQEDYNQKKEEILKDL